MMKRNGMSAVYFVQQCRAGEERNIRLEHLVFPSEACLMNKEYASG